MYKFWLWIHLASNIPHSKSKHTFNIFKIAWLIPFNGFFSMSLFLFNVICLYRINNKHILDSDEFAFPVLICIFFKPVNGKWFSKKQYHVHNEELPTKKTMVLPMNNINCCILQHNDNIWHHFCCSALFHSMN